MKKLVLLTLATMMMVGCMEHYKETRINSDYSVRVIDSCEYIVLNHSGIKAHKGNCKYCQQRMRKLMMEVRDSLLWQVE